VTREEKDATRERWRKLVRSGDPLPDSGLYAVFSGDRLLYVGMSFFMETRLTLHNNRDLFMEMNANRVVVREIKDPDMCAVVERFLIWKLKPPLNKQVIQCGDISREYRWLRDWHCGQSWA